MANTRAPRAWASSYYLLFYGAGATYWPFQVLYYQSRGLSGSQIGFIAAVSTLISLLAAPVWTGIADASNRHRTVFVAATLAASVFLVLISQARQLWVLLAFASLTSLSTSVLIPLMDNSVVSMLGTQSDRYGRIRLWGSIGWGILAPGAGWFVQVNGLPWAFGVAAIILILSLGASFGVPFAAQENREPYWSGARKLLANRQWRLFLFVTFVAGMGSAVYNNYLFAYLEGLGASKTFMGVALTVATISELPFFFFAGSLLKRYKARGLLMVSLVAICARCILYWAIRTPWGALPVQLLNGLGFSLLWSAGVSFARESAPPGLGATAQGLFGAMIFGFGAAAGGLLGGVLLGSIGAPGMYGVFGLATFAGLIAYVLGDRWLSARTVGR